MNRLLSRRERKSKGSIDGKDPNSVDLYQIFSLPEIKKKIDKDDEKSIKAISKELARRGIHNLREPQIEYALRAESSRGNVEKAIDLLLLFEDSVSGVLRPYNPANKLLGAVNRQAVTCYLDALLFAMFARLDSFEGILHDDFPDAPRKRLATLLRFWVNMLRAGKLITVDITKQLQESLAECGWEDATKLKQQDTSEAFTFITDKLELPLLTLKMDIYHTGKEDAADDHKFVNERLLEVAIPPNPEDGSVITLENCLETYFNNRIEVKRHLQRRNTVQSFRSVDAAKGQILHIEAVEVPSRPGTPDIMTPLSAPTSPSRPAFGRGRTDSIFSERRINSGSFEKRTLDDSSIGVNRRHRASTIKREVLMPAWQFFSLIPWYTDNAPENDAQVAAHFSSKRPVLGICLKRYSMSDSGNAQKRDTFIDIPLEIGLPTFISERHMQEDFGNFKLVLQSVVCHRGSSLTSGHYISLVRTADTRPGNDGPAPLWMRFNDLARDRVTYVDIKQALKDESPYLLFYQVQPIQDDLPSHPPPSYKEANEVPGTIPEADKSESVSTGPTAGSITDASTTGTDADEIASRNELVTVSLNDSNESSPELPNGLVVPSIIPDPSDRSTHTTELSVKQPSTYSSNNGFDDASTDPRGRSSFSTDRRSSVAFDESLLNAANGNGPGSRVTTAPTTPAEDNRSSFFSTSRRGSKSAPKKSRPNSQSSEGRLSITMSRLTARLSKDRLSSVPAVSDTNGTVTEVHEIDPNPTTGATTGVATSVPSGTSIPAHSSSLKSFPAVVTAEIKRAKSARHPRGDKEKKRRSGHMQGLMNGKAKAKTVAENDDADAVPDRQCAVM
ncbi:cysteine proteinase [Aulographum hederae CBS 113979]|uniref:ubiquitinyl hydrolase 1 n=1 Tax=Aulographum hederae CBS 113979 TaxID=1176131 RepID=A0A6G1GRJ8_9PEZI|nr:cysteine proteinase [Aulographum hederae CBS 113979]